MAFTSATTPTPAKVPMFQGDNAGGDLTGTYPNPSIRTGIITSDKIATSAVGTNEIADASITAAKLVSLSSLGIFPLINQSDISSGLITNSHISSNAFIDTTKLAEGNLFVKTSNFNQIISGIKEFSRPRTQFQPKVNSDITNKLYVDQRVLLSGTGSSSGTISGSGTTQFIPKFISSSTVANSIMFENAGQIQVNGRFLSNNGAISGNTIIANSILQGHVASGYVDLNTFQTNISGTKLFHRIKASGNPIDNNDLATKLYVDTNTTTAAGNRTELPINQPAHGFSQGQIVRHDGSKYSLSQANDATTAEVYGYINEIVDSSNFKLVLQGDIIKSGLSAGNVYFLSPSVAGDVTLIEPITSGYVSKPVLLSTGPISAIFNNMRGSLVSSGNSGPSGLSTTFMDLSTDQVASGIKTFHRIRASGNPIVSNDLATKGYVDSNSSSATLDGCRVYNTTNFTVNNSTTTVLPFNTERYDNAGMHDTTSGNNTRITVQTSGVYVINGNTRFAVNATGNRTTSFKINGVRFIGSNGQLAAVSPNATGMMVSTIWYFIPGEFVELTVFQNSGGVLDVEASDAFGYEFAVQKVSS